MYNDGAGNSCSSGFGVRDAYLNHYLLSAAHCGTTGDTWSTGVGLPVGTVVENYPTYEAMLIHTPDTTAPDGTVLASGSGSSIYTGQTDPSGAGVGETAITVSGWSAPYVGQYVCQSDAYSGEICNLKVTNDNGSYILAGSGTPVGDAVEMEQQAHISGGGQGDSGGPVFSISGTSAIASGIVSAMDGATEVSCTGVTYSGRICAWRMYYANIQQVLSITQTSLN